MAHREQRQSENIAEPDYIETGANRTEVSVSDAQAQHHQAQAAASGGDTHGPSAKPGHEPVKDEHGHDEADRGGTAAHTEKPSEKP